MKYNFLQTLTIACYTLVSALSFGQTTITYQNSMTPNGLVNNVLLGFGVTASNVTFNSGSGANVVDNARSFTATNFPFSQGVYIRTEGGSVVSGDADLNDISTNSVENGGILEFDFVAAGNNLSFNYMFASAEYPTYVCSQFNDVFGFFISGPGINGPYSNNAVNIALIPNTSIPVAINTVNSGNAGFMGSSGICAAQDPNWQSNSVYYTTQYATYSGEGYNGGTITLPADIQLQCGETYHIKIAVANIGDEALDSGVYLEANSFTSDAVIVAVATVSGDSTMIEGCTTADLMFIRPQSQINDTLVINYQVGGTATMGTDYNNLPNPITFLPGEDTIILTINPIQDGISDNNETVIITTEIINPCGDTIVSTGTLVILDSVVIDIQFTNPTVFCVSDSVPVNVTATGGFAPHTFEWSNGDTGSPGYLATANATQGTTEYYVTATDACGYVGVDTVVVTVNQTLNIDTLISTPANCLPVGTIVTQAFPYGAHLQNPNVSTSYNLTFDWTYASDTTITFPNQSSLQNLPGGWYHLELTDNVIGCTVSDSVFVDVEDVPQAVVTADPGSGCSPLQVTFTNSSQHSNQYYWNFGDGTTTTTSDLSAVTHTFDSSSNIMLVASNGNVSCNDTTVISVAIVECGCMDPNGINYSPTAVIDDGSCVYPIPTVDAPNVITLNDDNVNDFFFLNTEYAESIELTIVDRWGNMVFHGVGNQITPPMWNGNNQSGTQVDDGVYFYRYIVTGKLGDVLEGHGFLTVVK